MISKKNWCLTSKSIFKGPAQVLQITSALLYSEDYTCIIRPYETLTVVTNKKKRKLISTNTDLHDRYRSFRVINIRNQPNSKTKQKTKLLRKSRTFIMLLLCFKKSCYGYVKATELTGQTIKSM